MRMAGAGFGVERSETLSTQSVRNTRDPGLMRRQVATHEHSSDSQYHQQPQSYAGFPSDAPSGPSFVCYRERYRERSQPRRCLSRVEAP